MSPGGSQTCLSCHLPGPVLPVVPGKLRGLNKYQGEGSGSGITIDCRRPGGIAVQWGLSLDSPSSSLLPGRGCTQANVTVRLCQMAAGCAGAHWLIGLVSAFL